MYGKRRHRLSELAANGICRSSNRNGSGKPVLLSMISRIHKPNPNRLWLRDLSLSVLRPFDRCGLGVASTIPVAKVFVGLSPLRNCTTDLRFAVSRRFTIDDSRASAYGPNSSLVCHSPSEIVLPTSLARGLRHDSDLAKYVIC